MRPVAVLRNGISKRKAVLPSCEAESDAGEVRDNGRIPEIARSMPVPAVCYRQLRIVLHYSRTKEPFQGTTADRKVAGKVAGDTGRQISRGKDTLTNRRMTFFRLPPAYCHAVLRVEPVQPFCFSRLNIRTYGAKSESVIQGNIVTDTGCRQDIYCKQFVISCKICII